MKSEFQFFMHPHDEAEFFRFVGTDASLAPSTSHKVVVVYPRPGLQFWQSGFADRLLTAGRIAVLSDDTDVSALYRRWRRWLRARYSNDFVCYSEFFAVGERKVIPAKSFWVSPCARDWLAADPEHTFRQFTKGAVVFVPPDQRPISAA